MELLVTLKKDFCEIMRLLVMSYTFEVTWKLPKNYLDEVTWKITGYEVT